MKAYEYLGRALQMDKQIDCKLDQVERLRALAQRITASYDDSGASRSAGGSVSPMEDAIIRLMEAENALNTQIAALIDIKAEIQGTVQKVNDGRLRLLLEKRYLCCMTWEVIAVDMGVSYRWLMTLHSDALSVVDRILRKMSEEKNLLTSQQFI